MLVISSFNYGFLSWNEEQFRKKKLQKKIKLHHEIVLSMKIFSIELKMCICSLFILRLTFLLEHLKSSAQFTAQPRMSEHVERQHYSILTMFFVPEVKIINSHLSKTIVFLKLIQPIYLTFTHFFKIPTYYLFRRQKYSKTINKQFYLN